MLIRNIRYGRATNSSSMHSIVYNNKFLKLEDVNEACEGEFGRFPAFQLVSKEAKSRYLKAILITNVEAKLGFDMMEELENDFRMKKYKYWGVDHQSLLYFPEDIYGSFERTFWTEFQEFILQDGVVIVGNGDEMDDDEMIKLDARELTNIMKCIGMGDLMTYKNGNYWIMFNKNYGDKFRVCFQLEEKLEPVFPELIDMKITDKCNHNCNFCYQGSTKDGKHCDNDLLIETFKSLPEMTEIVLGGGDILTIHETAAQIINKYSDRFQLSSTINGENYEKKYNNVRKLLNKSLKALGVSISSSAGLKNFKKILKDFPDVKEIVAHIIPDMLDERHLKKLIVELSDIQKTNRYDYMDYSTSGAKILLLGFKPVGRGTDIKTEHHGWLIPWIKKYEYSLRIGVDTKFIIDYPEVKNEVDGEFFTEHEGEFSMYIDLVEKIISPSSWDNRKINIDEFKDIKDKNYNEYRKLQEMFSRIKQLK